MSTSVTKSVEEWLEKGGYPLELGVTRTLRELNYDCFKSMFYLDAESNKAREIDLVAEAYAGVIENISFRGRLLSSTRNRRSRS